MKRHVLDMWAHTEPRFGGVGPAASSLGSAVAGLDWISRQVAICGENEVVPSDGICPSVEKLVERGPRPIADWRLRGGIRRYIEECAVCHVHGLWLPHSLAVRSAARKFGKPVVSSAHGMLEQWDLSNKRLKKQVYSVMFERPSLALSSCLRALSEQEACDYRRYGLRNPIAIIPNGIAAMSKVVAVETLAAYPELAGKKIVLFLSRIHHKKGILNLIEAWRTVAEQDPDAHLVIAGGDFADTEAKAREMVRAYSLSRRVTFCGVVHGRRKMELLSAAHALCLPSYSEGLSVAVLEALSMGVPVVITKACNIGGVESSAAGYVTSNYPSRLSETLLTCLSLSTAEWESMGIRAQKLARDRYEWSKVGGMMASVYGWLLGGAKPACIVD